LNSLRTPLLSRRVLRTGAWLLATSMAALAGAAFQARHAHLPIEGGLLLVVGLLAVLATAVAGLMARRRLRVDAELRRNLQRLDEVQRAAGIGFWRNDLPSGRVEWSGQTQAIMGLLPHAPPALSAVLEALHPDDVTHFEQHRNALLAGAAEADLICRIVRPIDGAERVVHSRSKVAARDAEGRATVLVGTVQDVTEPFGTARLAQALSGAMFLSGDAVLFASISPQGEWRRVWANAAYDALRAAPDGAAPASAQSQLFDAQHGLLREESERVRAALRSRQALRLERRLDLARGRRWVEVDLTPVVSEVGAVHWLLVLRDVHARHQAEERLRESEHRYRMLFDLHPLPLLTYSRATRRIVDVNLAATVSYGYTREQFLKMSVLDILAPQEIEEARAYLASWDGRTPPRHRWHHRTAAGEVIAVDIYGSNVPHEGPDHRLICPVNRTAEQAATEALQRLNAELEAAVAERTRALAQREKQYRTIADLSPVVVWQADERGDTTYLNRTWYDMVGPRDDDWLGCGWLDVVHPADLPAVRVALEQAIGQAAVFRARYRVRTASGSYRSFMAVGSPVRTPAGDIESWVGVSTDITELEHRQQRLQQLNDELESFSYSVSHDLRAPVQVMKGFLDAMLAGQVGEIDDTARSYLQRVRRNAERMDELISDLLALARLSRETLRCERFDVAALARQVVETVQERYPDRRVRCSTPQEFELVADRRLVQAMLENLIDNAVKFSPGPAAGRIEFSARREIDAVLLEVADRGVGFHPDHAHRLFHPFQRLHSQQSFHGTGIGLVTVARIARLHGGSVDGRLRAGGGAVFQVRLPLLPEGVCGMADDIEQERT
jgi:PAS domain S-box-containing protein